jgi:hypothetical protein
VNVDFRPTIQARLPRIIDWTQYRFDRVFSGVETERHYDPVAIVEYLGWSLVRSEFSAARPC